MLEQLKKWETTPVLLGAALVILGLLLSLALRYQDFASTRGAPNLEATYHVLLTATALGENPVGRHLFLPIVTLGKASDKHVPWGSTASTPSGDSIYTSFTPPGFLAPYFVFALFKLQPTVKHLAAFNFVMQCASAVALFLFLQSLLRYAGHPRLTAACAAALACAIGIFSREALLSFGLIYWSQSLYQLILIVSIYLFFLYLSCAEADRRRRYGMALLVFVFIGAWTEWTAYVFNAGLTLLLWRMRRERPEFRTQALRVVIVSLVAGLATIVHYSMAVGLIAALKSLGGRFLARDASSGSLTELLAGYALSYGLFWLILFGILAGAYFNGRAQVEDGKRKLVRMVFLAACAPLLENILMLQHATQFSFDRLKFILPAAVILAFAFAGLKTTGRWMLGLLLLLASVQGYQSYRADLKHYAAWPAIDAANKALAAEIAGRVESDCALYASKPLVRGYANLVFGRAMYEVDSLREALDLASRRRACATVYLEGRRAFSDLARYTQATLVGADGSTHIIQAAAGH